MQLVPIHRGHTHVVPKATMASSDDVGDKRKQKKGGGAKLSPTVETRNGVAMPRMLYGTAWWGTVQAEIQ
jgi:hypothetical protein